MTLRAIDWIKVASAEDINRGLDEIEKQPALQINGPYYKFRFVGRDRLPQAVTKAKAKVFDPWMDESIPRKGVVGPKKDSRQYKVTLPTSQSISTDRPGVHYLVGFRTPDDHRRPKYYTQEESELKALQKWERKHARRCANLASYTFNTFQRITERVNKKLAYFEQKLREAYASGKEKRIAFYQGRIRYWKDRYAKGNFKPLQRKIQQWKSWADESGKDQYVAQKCDILNYQTAQRKAQWLAQPKLEATLLPVYHLKLSRGYYQLKVSLDSLQGRHGMPGEPGEEQQLELDVPVDGLMGGQDFTSNPDYRIAVDETKLAEAIRSATPKSVDSVVDSIVSLVEMKDLESSIKEFGIVWQGLRRCADASRTDPFRRYKRVLRTAMVTAEGLWSVIRWLSARDLCYKFGTQDIVSYTKTVVDTFTTNLENLCRRASVLLRQNMRKRTVHRVIDRSTTSSVVRYPLRSLVNSYVQNMPWTGQYQWELPYRLNDTALIPEDSVLEFETVTTVEQRLTLQATSRLENELGIAIGDDEAFTRFWMSILGLDKWISAIWDLTPWTFVFDWFVDFGSFLSENQAKFGGLHLGWELFGGLISEKRTEVTTARVYHGHVKEVHPRSPEDGDGAQPFHFYFDAAVVGQPVVRRFYRRNTLSKESLLRYAHDFEVKGIKTGNLGLWQLVTGGELLATRGPANLHNLTKSLRGWRKWFK